MSNTNKSKNLLLKFGELNPGNNADFEEWNCALPTNQMSCNDDLSKQYLLRIKFLIRLKLLMDYKIDRIVEQVVRIQESINPGNTILARKKVKAFYQDLMKAKRFDQIKIMFGPFESLNNKKRSSKS